MNKRFEDSTDDLERQLSTISVLPPGEDFSSLAQEALAAEKTASFWDSAVARVFAVACILAMVAVGGYSFLQSNPDTSLDRPDISQNEASLLPIGTPGSAQSPYLLGTHFDAIEAPPNTDGSEDARVRIFFSYPCEPCYRFDAFVNEWSIAATTAGVTAELIPATWSDRLGYYAQVFYVAEALGVGEDAHNRIYSAMHDDAINLDDLPNAIALFAQLGVSTQAFYNAFNSEEVRERLQRTVQMNADFEIAATPTIIVDDQYRVIPNAQVGYADMFEITDFLLDCVDRQPVVNRNC